MKCITNHVLCKHMACVKYGLQNDHLLYTDHAKELNYITFSDEISFPASINDITLFQKNEIYIHY